MAASNSDNFTEVGNPGSATTLAAPGHLIAGTTFTVASTSNWPTNTGVIFAVDTVSIINGVTTRNPGTYTEFEGVVTSGTTISNAVLRFGTDQNYPAGSTTRVYIPVSSSRENRLVQGLQVSLDQDGTLKAGAVDNAAALASNVVTTAKILDNNVTGSKLSTDAIKLGYAEITTSFATTTTGSYVDVPGLSTTVTVPSGGRDVEIEFCGVTSHAGAGGVYTAVAIMEGTTVLNMVAPTNISNNYNVNNSFTARVAAPSAGTHTYKIAISTNASTGSGFTVQAGTGAYGTNAYRPFILVKLI